ncbi:uncharacterized protein LTR77_003677 [Saxophila tyrrhenica]|uniref:F-box domain-containing protein n=1 Tax=Saxophila tyrrhenica TaxID=1690608 RepID=A0AAV9PER5_9PEZI|nr:hypothetical protein LTR77_003677 [Saxophila tyrrhenica]
MAATTTNPNPPTPSPPTQSAATSTFAIPELRELITAELPPRDILVNANKVCRSWYYTITTSASATIREKLFLPTNKITAAKPESFVKDYRFSFPAYAEVLKPNPLPHFSSTMAESLIDRGFGYRWRSYSKSSPKQRRWYSKAIFILPILPAPLCYAKCLP